MANGHNGKQQSARGVLLILAAATATLIVGVAAFLPAARLWGINHLAFYPVWLRVLALAAVGATFLPPVARGVYAVALSVPRWLRGGSTVHGVVIITILTGAAVAVFWFGQAATHLLGDGQLIAQSFEAASRREATATDQSISAIIELEPVAKGGKIVYVGASKAAREWFGGTATDGIRFSACVAGALILLMILIVVRRGTGSPHVDTWLLFLAVFSCAMQLFFGYVELYAPLMVALVMFVLLSIMAIHGRVSVWMSFAILLVALAMHVQAILFLPSMIYLGLWRYGGPRRPMIERFGVVVCVGATIAGAIAARFFTGLEQFFLPVVADEKTYGIVSPAHVVDVVNELLMLLPVLPVMLALVWLTRANPEPKTETETEPEPAARSGWLSTTAERQFLLIGILSCLIYIVGFYPEIGFARDWDLFMMTVVVLVPFAVLTLHRYIGQAEPSHDTIAKFSAPVIVLSIVFSTAWFGLNASKARTIGRFERILAFDQTHASYAYENLAILYHDDERYDDAVRVMELCVKVSPNPRLKTRLAVYYGDAGQRERGLNLLSEILGQHPAYEDARLMLIDWLERAGRWDLMVGAARGGIDYSGDSQHYSKYCFYYGEAMIRTGNPEEGIVWFKNALALKPPPHVTAHIQKRLAEFEGR